MIAHLCRLAWNRRRTNLLLVAELFLSFLVLTPLIAGWVLFAVEQSKPLGFEYEDVWFASVRNRDHDDKEATLRNIELVWRELRALDGVQAVALASKEPFHFSESWNGISSVYLSDEGLEVLELRLLSGRWFQPEDAALDWTPVVIDQELSHALFGDEDPLGKVIGDSPIIDLQDGYNLPSPDHVRVVGVVEACFYYRTYQDVEVPGMIFLRLPDTFLQVSTDSDEWVHNPLVYGGGHFLVKSYPSTGSAFGEALRSRIQAVVPAKQSVWLEVKSLADSLDHHRHNRLNMLKFLAVISGLLMLMVALGLVGMTWQNVRRRTQEIGIRRAGGAPGGRIYGQFLGELAVLVTVAIVLGCVPIVQFGLLELLLESLVPAYVVAGGLGATALVLYGLVLLCGLYPSWLASRVRPAEALHYE